MPGQGRLGDKANVALDAHGCPACPHPAIGPAIQGSPDVNVNRRPALRIDDPGIHAACCGANTWTATAGSMTVFINGKGAHRMGDQNRHCGGMGQLVEGSPNVIVGESGGGGGSASAPGAGSAGGGDATGGAPGGSSATAAPASAGSAPARADHAGASAPGTGDTGADPAHEDAASPIAVDEDQIEVEVVDTSGAPQSGVEFELTFPDGTTRSGRTSADGVIRFSGLPSSQRGACKLMFPALAKLSGGGG